MIPFLFSGIGFVFDKIAEFADQELNNEDVLRERLLAAQMRLELGEISEDEFADEERVVVERLREIHAERQPQQMQKGDRITGIEARFVSDEEP